MLENNKEEEFKKELDILQDWLYRADFSNIEDLDSLNFVGEIIIPRLNPVCIRLLDFSLNAENLKGKEKVITDFILKEFHGIAEVIFERNKDGEFEQIDLVYLQHVFEKILKAFKIYNELENTNYQTNTEDIQERISKKFEQLYQEFLKLKKDGRNKEKKGDDALNILDNLYNELLSIFSNRSSDYIVDDKYFFLKEFLSESRRQISIMLHMDNDEEYGELPSSETLKSVIYECDNFQRYITHWLLID
jgi:hypothetical protein